MNDKIKEKEYTWPVVSDDPLEEGFRILARIILRRIMADRAVGKLSKEMIKQNEVQLNYEI